MADLDRYNVVWNSPSGDPAGSMPIGNGDLGMNIWTEENGDVVFLIDKTDSWSENGELLKLGRVRLKFDPSPFKAGPQFRQMLLPRFPQQAQQASKLLPLPLPLPLLRILLPVQAVQN